MRKIICGFCFLSMLLLLAGSAGAGTACVEPMDDFPPEGCAYDSPSETFIITNGLPPASSILADGPMDGIGNVVKTPGGSLGGEIEQFTAMLTLTLTGTGSLAGFFRNIQLPLQCETHIAPRTPGDPVQSFDTEMYGLNGQLPTGDPDFDLLRIWAGSGFGMPSPGHTTLTRLPDGTWNVDSFFDIEYRIDFVGAPGGPLSGMSGSTTATIRMETGQPVATGGQDCYDVNCGASRRDFNQSPIPADFFDPGSDPFSGIIILGGPQDGLPDTIVRRLNDFYFPDLNVPVTVPIELVELRLVSCEPIIVTYNGGYGPELWDVNVGLSLTNPSQGMMTAIKTHTNGGTFEAQIYVQPLLTFTRVSNPSDVRVLEGPPIILETVEPYPWVTTPPKPNYPCPGNGFYPCGVNFIPGVQEQPYLILRSQGGDVLELEPPHPPNPHIALDTKPHWLAGLAGGSVTPMNSSEWADYMGQWNAYRDPQTDPYPSNQYYQPDLYAWDPNEVCPTDPNARPEWPDSQGLVMAWHEEQSPPGSYSAAWKYVYPDDPDLTNVVITVTVNPPCAGINTVSLGLKDINGNIRAWHWNVPGTLACGVATTITIDTSIAGPAAGTPVADGYMNNPAFDITQVVELLFDENCQWVAGVGVPPPGQTIPRAWNYWYDLIITPKPVKTIGPLKWSQPPAEVSPGVILGWDEVSVRDNPPLMADDWLCKDPRPVTDVHWWGSFIGWYEPVRPPLMPSAFHIGIWADVPKDPNNPKSFSHPDELIWEYTCTDYQWNFYGYDKDPRKTAIDAAGNVVIFDPLVKDSCFQFNCVFPESVRFYQEPSAFNQGRVYWLSIAAIYPAGIPVVFPWGWKTRPHHFNDDAVRILQLQGGGWPPAIGSKWLSGTAVEYPKKISWDLAFELTTNKPEPANPVADLNLDGIVDFVDFAYLANQWLIIWP